MSFPHIAQPARIYPNPTGNPFVKESFYLSNPKTLFGFTPKGFSIASPPSRSEESKKRWRSQIEKRISSDNTFARRFLEAVDGMQKRAEEHLKAVWGS